MTFPIILLISLCAFFVFTTLTIALALRDKRKIGRAALELLDYVAKKYSVVDPYGFDCMYFRTLAVRTGWKRNG